MKKRLAILLILLLIVLTVFFAITLHNSEPSVISLENTISEQDIDITLEEKETKEEVEETETQTEDTDTETEETEDVDTEDDVEIEEDDTNTDTETDLLDIPLTDAGVRAALEDWKKIPIPRGATYYAPPNYIVTKTYSYNIWEIAHPTNYPRDFIAISRVSDMTSFYGRPPTNCPIETVSEAVCQYGDDPEVAHVIKIMTYFH